MISFIRGLLIEKQPTFALLETGGIGYEISIPVSTYQVLGEVGHESQLHTYLHVREDAMNLFGFSTIEERQLFLDLLSVSGIGPKLALTILSKSHVQQIYQNIADGNESSLVKIKGLGKKTAQRLILDLKDRALNKVQKRAPAPDSTMDLKSETEEQSVRAMMSLGYTRSEAEKAIMRAAGVKGSLASVEELIRIALGGESN
ncbi:MAG: Holliday junction branch migration protein RuvA [candidate division KSB1 bacterium]|nr:Holliday junction branch migration protein RuvA [candidate division KSB1 bacterium]